MKRMLQWLSGLAVVLVAQGCCHLRSSSSPRTSQPPPASALAVIGYARSHPLTCTESNLESHARFTVHRIQMPSAVPGARTNGMLELDYYRPSVATNSSPVIVVLPILGGGYPLEKFFCSYFARHGMAAVLVRRDGLKKVFERLEEIDDTLRHSAIDARQALDWIEARPELNSTRIGVFGISMGGIRAAFLTPLDPRIRAATIALAGGDLPYIIRHSSEGGLARRRQAFLKSSGMSEEQFQEALKPVMTCDPMSVASSIDRSRVLLVVAAFDKAVPTRKGLELRRAMGRPETVFIPAGHYTSLLFLPYIKSACLRFFREKLDGLALDPVVASKR